MNKIKELSVFFPAYNLESQISTTVEKAVDFIPKIADKYELLVINDGSTDNTGKILENIQKKYPKQVKIITHRINKGYGEALKSGLYTSKYAFIAFTDGDGQFDISELPKFVEVMHKKNSDLVIGYYLKRKVSKFTIVTSKIWEVVVYVLFGLKVRDIDCGFKLIKREVIESIERLESKRGAFISSELLIKAKEKGFKIEEVGVSHYERPGDKKTATGRKLNVIVNSFVDLIKLWIKIHR